MAKSVKYILFNSKLTTVVSVSMVLVLLGITTIVLLMSKNLTDHVRENFIFKLTLKEGITQKTIDAVGDTLRAKPYIKEVNYVSKELAVQKFAEELGEDPMESLDVNPLPNTYEVSLKAAQLAADSLKNIEDELIQIKGITEVDYPHNLVETFSRNVRAVSAVFLFMAGVLLVISFALINNTIRLLIYSDRFLIQTMKQVGATRNFIRKPYMKQGLIIGLIASGIAIVIILLMLFCMGDLTSDTSLFIDLQDTTLYLATFGVILVSGILITELSTYLAVNKYLRQSLNTMYLI